MRFIGSQGKDSRTSETKSRCPLVGWMKSWIGLLLTVTDGSTTFTVVVFRIKVNLKKVHRWKYTLVIDPIGQLSRVVIGCLSVKSYCCWLWRLWTQVFHQHSGSSLKTVPWYNSTQLGPSLTHNLRMGYVFSCVLQQKRARELCLQKEPEMGSEGF